MKSILKQIDSLQVFKLDPREIAPIYHNAIQIPPLLVHNLKSQHRVIKEFTGEDAIIKAFYFNLMKLAFELENQDRNYSQIVRQMLTGQTQFDIGQLQDINFTDKQYRNLLNEFIDLLESQEISNFQETIKLYPIIDEMLLSIFKKIIPLTLLIKDQRQDIIIDRVLHYLAKKFQIQLEKVNQIYKCIQSDIFIYGINLNTVYLIFVNQLGFIKEVTQYSNSEQRKLSKRNSFTNSNNFTKKSIQTIQNANQLHKKKSFNTVISILDSNKLMSHKKKSLSLKNSIKDSKTSKKDGQTQQKDSFRRKKQAENQYYQQNQRCNLSIEDHSQKSFNKHKETHSDLNYDIRAGHMDNLSEDYNHSKISQGHSSKSSEQFNDYSNLYDNISKIQSTQRDYPQNYPHFKKIVTKNSESTEEKNYSQVFSTDISPKKFSHLDVNSNIERKKTLKEQYKKENSQDQKLDEEVNNSGYDKFTDSKILDCLDEEFKREIRTIKKKYRQNRKNVRHI